jgi:nicotinamidase/pyrazinamidase
MTDTVSIQANDVFLVVDVQNDFCPGGNLAVPDGDAVVPVINRLAGAFEHVVLTQDWHPAGHTSFASSHGGKAPFEVIEMPYGPQVLWPDHCVQGSEGAEFHPDLDVRKAELVIRKGYRSAIDSYSAFYENDHTTPTGLAGYLRERGFTRIFAVGLALDFCVRYSAEDAVACGFHTVLIDDACRAIDTEGSLEAARASFAEKGVTVIESGRILA